ncbi:MAG: DNA-processing protein DprA [Hyphomicrobiaceae bacterium]|nr:DNA-processing protein DprA [Hyphomicrobiaceae bacterium]
MTKGLSLRPTLFTAAPLPVAPLGTEEKIACLRLIRSEQVGPASFRALINHFGGAQRALDALPEMSRRGGRRNPIRIFSRAAATAELEAADRAGAVALFTVEPGYPHRLAWLDQPPPMIYVKGRHDLFARQTVALIGSRRCSAAGQAMARRLGRGLADAGVVVVSGLARGIDGAAHEAALDGGTIAVLAGGPDNIYPPEHADLYAAIAERGAVVSERPPGFQPRGVDFPRRNRIISGLSDAVVVIEAAQRSGSLITAGMAADQGRDVLAVPGHPLDPRAEGTNRLIKDGAQMVTDVADVLSALSPTTPRPADGPSESGHLAEATRPLGDGPPPLPVELSESDRDRVVAALGPAPVALDDVVRSTGLPVRNVQIALLEISLAGRIEHHGHNLLSLRASD